MRLEEALYTTKFTSEIQKVTINLIFTSHWIQTKINKCLKEFGLTTEQFNVMRILKGKYPEKMCVKNIGMRMIEKNSNVPRILDRLEKKGYIIRQQSNEDRRETVTTLTESGLAILEKASSLLLEKEIGMMNINETTALELNAILENIRNS